MPKRKPNEEVFMDGDREIILVADFGALVAINSKGRDVAHIYSDLSNGLMPPEDILNVIACTISGCDEDNKFKLAEELIGKYGLQECAIMAQIILSHGVIGSEKKRAIARAEMIKSLTDQLVPSLSTSFKKVGLSWAAMVLTSTVLVCLISSYFMSPIV